MYYNTMKSHSFAPMYCQYLSNNWNKRNHSISLSSPRQYQNNHWGWWWIREYKNLWKPMMRFLSPYVPFTAARCYWCLKWALWFYVSDVGRAIPLAWLRNTGNCSRNSVGKCSGVPNCSMPAQWGMKILYCQTHVCQQGGVTCPL